VATTEKHILNRLYIIAGCMFIFAVAVIVQLLNIQIVEGDKYNQLAEERTYRNFTIPANRGNLYDTNGNLLATSISKYDIRFDAVTVTDKNFEENIRAWLQSCPKCWDKALRTGPRNYVPPALTSTGICLSPGTWDIQIISR
jgi:cell division protein FtsI (penicillin-binding protein 3)